MAEKSNISDVKNWSIIILNSARPNEYVVISEYDTRKVIDMYEFQKMERFSFRGIFVSMFVKV